MAETESFRVRDPQQILHEKVEQWRSKLLDIGNRNPLIKCSFNAIRGVLEIHLPDAETVWRTLAAEGEAGAVSMRFPWRRELVPPPPDEDGDLAPGTARSAEGNLLSQTPESLDEAATFVADVGDTATSDDRRRIKEWHPSLEECRRSSRLQNLDLLVDLTDRGLDRRLRTMDGHARLAMSEQGVHALFMVFGFLKWYESPESNDARHSPLMLVPVSLSRASTIAPWELTEAEDDAIDNLCLRQRLRQDYGLELPPLPDINDLEEPGARTRFLTAVQAAISKCDRWEVEDRAALGLFAFPKVAMWKDLGDHANAVVNHPLCKAIAGEVSGNPMMAFGPVTEIPSAAELDDKIAPGEIKAILDCDSSQMEAMVAARRGVSLVLDGPPGTGKSQTIANMIADGLAVGKTILFVSEKVSALQVVKRRLDEKGLGDFCLECHSSKANRKSVLFELESCLNLEAEVYSDAQPRLNEARDNRNRLNEYVRSIHRPRSPLGLSPYELFGNVGRLTRLGMATKSRCELPDPAKVDRTTFDGWLNLLTQAADNKLVISNYDQHPWRGCRLVSRSLALNDDLQHHLLGLSQAFRSISECVQPLVDAGLIECPPVVSEINHLRKTLLDSLTTPRLGAGWMKYPDRAATIGLELQALASGQQTLKQNLADYTEQLATTVDVDGLRDKLFDVHGWTSQLTSDLPTDVEAQHSFLSDLAETLQRLSLSAEETQTHLPPVIKLLQIPLREDLPVAAIRLVVQIAECIVESGTMQPAWLDRNNWNQLKQAAERSLVELDSLTALEAELQTRVALGRLPELNISKDSLTSLHNSWTIIANLIPDDTDDALGKFLTVIDSALKTAQDAALAADAIRIGLGLSSDESMTMQQSTQLLSALPDVLNAQYIHLAWKEATTRSRLMKSCQAAIDDLSDAQQIEERLSDRLSHRAFSESAGELAAQASQFSSPWKRLFGGFGQYRKAVADLYRTAVPDKTSLLQDMELLCKYHRRLNDVRTMLRQHENTLPPARDFQDAEAWRQLMLGINATESLVNRMGDWVKGDAVCTNLDTRLLQAEGRKLDISFRLLSQHLLGLGSNRQWDQTPVETVIADLEALRTATVGCRQALAKASVVFHGFPPGIKELLQIADKAIRRETLSQGLHKTFEDHSDWMPAGSTATQESTWRKILAGVRGAEHLAKFFRNSDSLRHVLCTAGQIDAFALSEAAATLKNCLQKLIGHVCKCEQHLNLCRPNEADSTSARKMVSELKLTSSSAARAFAARAEGLQELQSYLRRRISIDDARLEADLQLIRQLQEVNRKQTSHLSILRDFGIDDVSIVDKESLNWLLQVSREDRVTPLIKAMTSQDEIRQQVTRAVQQINSDLAGEFKASWKFLMSLFELDTDVSVGITIRNAEFSELAQWFDLLRQQTTGIDDWMKFSRWKRDMRQAGFGAIVDELLSGRFEPDEVCDVVAVRFYRKLFDVLCATDKTLAEFEVEVHERIRERFCYLDVWEVKAAATRIRQFQLGRSDRPRSGFAAAASSELGILQKEIAKKRKHLPLRKLFASIPDVLQRLKPCIMMSPLSVSTFLESDKIRFDMVIFDEASQVFPWDAIGAIYRGSQIVVAGDEKQLPPTNFFSRVDAETDEEDDIGDFESILSLCRSINMPAKRLRWHYRSRREPLIAFSNRHFYDGDLVTFPSVKDAVGDAVRWEYVPDGRWVDRKNLKEAERVVDLVIDHFRNHSDRSLGVIAFNQTQQRAIEDLIYDRRRSDSRIDALLSGRLPDPLFIKNLETVQGDERDVILLTMGYGFNDAGRFLKNFGPLTKSGGERRLNVAVTRAREEVVFVTSVRAADMDISASNSVGTHLLKKYLEYAERGPVALADSVDSSASEAESPFEEEVAVALRHQGLDVVPQVGCGGFRIDLALKHSEHPGKFCLGIECDGASYHSSNTARDRDRIRQSVLESLGWRIVRIWSTDWVRDPDRQIQKIVAAYKSAISSSGDEVAQLPEPIDEDEGLEPTFVQTEQQKVPSFAAITDVPDQQIFLTAAAVLGQAGSTELDDLVKLIARELGFRRVGPRIRERIESHLAQELNSGRLVLHGDRVSLSEQYKASNDACDVTQVGLMPLSAGQIASDESDCVQDCKAIVDALRAAGGVASRPQLKRTLDWDEDRLKDRLQILQDARAIRQDRVGLRVILSEHPKAAKG
ncbi:MAG: DUF4011 domain-containing protein [Planctomycetaceae bacterium]|nr:DUF4011 domain-containing protein [Planctomycetaceae bacterium]